MNDPHLNSQQNIGQYPMLFNPDSNQPILIIPYQQSQKQQRDPFQNQNVVIPQQLLCQLSGNLMKTPVQDPDGHVFEREAILSHLATHGNYCPLDQKALKENQLISHRGVQAMLMDFHGGNSNGNNSNDIMSAQKNQLMTLKPEQLDLEVDLSSSYQDLQGHIQAMKPNLKDLNDQSKMVRHDKKVQHLQSYIKQNPSFDQVDVQQTLFHTELQFVKARALQEFFIAHNEEIAQCEHFGYLILKSARDQFDKQLKDDLSKKQIEEIRVQVERLKQFNPAQTKIDFTPRKAVKKSGFFSFLCNSEQHEAQQAKNMDVFIVSMRQVSQQLEQIELRLSKCDMINDIQAKLKEENEATKHLIELTMQLINLLVYTTSWEKAGKIWGLLIFSNSIAVTFRKQLQPSYLQDAVDEFVVRMTKGNEVLVGIHSHKLSKWKYSLSPYWQCKGVQFLKGGCVGDNKFKKCNSKQRSMLAPIVRFRCNACDFDLCNYCATEAQMFTNPQDPCFNDVGPKCMHPIHKHALIALNPGIKNQTIQWKCGGIKLGQGCLSGQHMQEQQMAHAQEMRFACQEKNCNFALCEQCMLGYRKQ